MKILCTLLLIVSISGCMYTNVPQRVRVPVKQNCYIDNKEKLWDDLTLWKNVMYSTRRHYRQYCDLKESIVYMPYCLELDRYHKKVEKYVSLLQDRYDTCRDRSTKHYDEY